MTHQQQAQPYNDAVEAALNQQLDLLQHHVSSLPSPPALPTIASAQPLLAQASCCTGTARPDQQQHTDKRTVHNCSNLMQTASHAALLGDSILCMWCQVSTLRLAREQASIGGQPPSTESSAAGSTAAASNGAPGPSAGSGSAAAQGSSSAGQSFNLAIFDSQSKAIEAVLLCLFCICDRLGSAPSKYSAACCMQRQQCYCRCHGHVANECTEVYSNWNCWDAEWTTTSYGSAPEPANQEAAGPSTSSTAPAINNTVPPAAAGPSTSTQTGSGDMDKGKQPMH